MFNFPETQWAPDNALLTALTFSSGRVGEWNQDRGKAYVRVKRFCSKFSKAWDWRGVEAKKAGDLIGKGAHQPSL